MSELQVGQINSTDGPTAITTTYRQVLRDITAQAGFPDTIDWPEKPA